MAEPLDYTQLLAVIQDLADNRSELLVAIAAFVISVVALIASLLQVAQQYYASAAGYSNCDPKVVGRWAETKKRVLRWTEFRFEVQFDAPVIFLCPPTNTNGPIADAPIYFVTGDDKSLDETWTTFQTSPRDEMKNKTEREKIHTADNERATWVTLLAALQTVEAESQSWQQRQYNYLNAAGPPREKQPPLAPPSLREHHTLVVAIQRKRRSWDTMPASVTKPYATTTMCHLVEMLAVLGIYWIEFDRSHSRFRAEGNGFTVTGENVSDLGLMFTFQVYGKSSFGHNRVIPVDEVKELCFGVAPTIYRETLDGRRLELANDELRGISLLQLGSTTDIAETLVVIGCNTNTVNYFTKPGMQHSHLFPVTFEILGMIGQTLHIENSCFRMLPNPTMHQWNRKAFSLRDLLISYADAFANTDEVHGANSRNPDINDTITEHLRRIQIHLSSLPPKSTGQKIVHIPLLNDLHRALDDMDEILTAKKRKQKRPSTQPPKQTQVDAKPSHQRTDSGLLINKETETQNQRLRREMVQDVLRSHIQEVLKMINEKPQDETKTSPASTFLVPDLKPKFEDIDAAAPEDKQSKFMEVYFKVIRVKVVGSAAGATRRRGSVVPGTVPPPPPPMQGIKRAGTEKSIPEDDVAPSEGHPTADGQKDSTHIEVSRVKSDLPLFELEVSHDDIWCILVFRMMCWLMLHDFHKKDIQNSKSELLGSRLPVYIA